MGYYSKRIAKESRSDIIYKGGVTNGHKTVSIPNFDVLREGANRLRDEKSTLRYCRCSQGRPQIADRIYRPEKGAVRGLQRSVRHSLDGHLDSSRQRLSREQHLPRGGRQ